MAMPMLNGRRAWWRSTQTFLASLQLRVVLRLSRLSNEDRRHRARRGLCMDVGTRVFGGKTRSLFLGDCRLSTRGCWVRLRPRCGLCCCCGTRSARRRWNGAAAGSGCSSVRVYSALVMKIAVRPLLLVRAGSSQRDECSRRQGACNPSHLLHVHR